MASADTLCKKLLNVKNTVVESHDPTISTRIRMVSFTSGSRHVPVHGTGMTVLSVAGAAPAMTVR